jgi:hypothetical protein
VPGLGDDHPVRHPDDPDRLAQDHLDLARIAVPALGEGDRLGPRLDRGEVHDRALGLRDDLLGDDEDVIRSERSAARQQAIAEPDERVGQEGRQVVTGQDLREPLEGEHGQVGRTIEGVRG